LIKIVQDVAWLPLDDAADAMVDISLNHGDSIPPVVNLSHPFPVSWSSIIGYVGEQLNVALVPYTEWLHALEGNLKDKTKTEVEHMQENPALRLLSFFQGARFIASATEKDAAHEAMGMALMDMEKAKEASPSLKTLGHLGPNDVNKWLAYWRRAGALPMTDN
jgi:hypothetical protein